MTTTRSILGIAMIAATALSTCAEPVLAENNTATFRATNEALGMICTKLSGGVSCSTRLSPEAIETMIYTRYHPHNTADNGAGGGNDGEDDRPRYEETTILVASHKARR